MPDNQVYENFQNWTFFLQEVSSLQDLVAKSYPFELNEQNFSLIPFTKFDLSSENSLQLLGNWRKDNEFAYPTRSLITTDGTSKWLENAVLNNENRLLFWIVDSSLSRLGHIGVVSYPMENRFEIDNVLRGIPSENPGLMAAALSKLEAIMEEEFSIEEIFLRVLESNVHAVDFYLAHGYSECAREELSWEYTATGSRLVPGNTKDDSFITMKKNFLESIAYIPGPILTAGPSISALENAYVADAVRNGWNAHHSDYLLRFEKEFAEYVGARYAMATSSCTGALHLSLLALGIGPGDEVIVPDITWVATASAVRYVGAKPVFVDVLPDSWTLDPQELKASITQNTKAIIPVHLYGYGARMPEIMAIAHEFNLKVVEDAAPAIGTQIHKKFAGTFGDFGCFSFQGAKLLVTGEGGMVVTDDPILYAKIKKIQDHGRKPGTFWIEELGFKYKMNNLTAALGLAQIQRAQNQIDRKRRINSWYQEGLRDIPGVSFQVEDRDTKSICWMSSFTLGQECKVDRDGLIAALKLNGIDSRPVFPSISQYKIWGYAPQVPHNSKLIGDSGINLPSGVLLNFRTVEKVIETIRKTL
ncbi:DegT/DnrJ/EryC1/StrS family aminotransferase [Actinobacteria bacterium IMCC25003]|nr:DegT/DnrJ/EryC1/StrS family aminotransferase [Actinobacteria bacterium IMCC25003]